MLTVRSEQMEALVDAQLPALTQAVEIHLRLHHAEAVAGLDDDELLRRIAVGMRRARRHGFRSLFGLGLFVALMFEIAPDFDADPRVARVLEDRTRPLDERLNAMETALTDEEWRRLADERRDHSWEDREP